jgi:hypothetical protein
MLVRGGGEGERKERWSGSGGLERALGGEVFDTAVRERVEEGEVRVEQREVECAYNKIRNNYREAERRGCPLSGITS